MRYGFVGLGHLGRNLATSLLRGGFDLTVTDLDASAAKGLVDGGAQWAADAQGVAEKVDAVITCLPSPSASLELRAGERCKLHSGAAAASSREHQRHGRDRETGSTLRRQRHRDARSSSYRGRAPCGGRRHNGIAHQVSRGRFSEPVRMVMPLGSLVSTLVQRQVITSKNRFP
jgi:hypothetical protein